MLLTHVQRTCCKCARAERVLNDIPERPALFWRVPGVYAACKHPAQETPQKMDDPDKLRLQYKIAVLRHQQNLMELALHQIHVVRQEKKEKRSTEVLGPTVDW